MDKAIEFLHEERQTLHEMSARGKVLNSKIDGGYAFSNEFGVFTVYAPRNEFQGPISSLAISNPKTGKSLDLLSFIPSGWNVELSQYPFGSASAEKKRVSAPIPTTKGHLVSDIHELEHAIDMTDLSKEEIDRRGIARLAVKKGKPTIEQKQLVIDEEKRVWQKVRKKVDLVEKCLQIKIIDRQEELEEFIEKRLNSYREVTTIQ